MIKKMMSLAMTVVMAAGILAGCGNAQGAVSDNSQASAESQTGDASDDKAQLLKMGLIMDADENAGYTASHMDGIRKALANLGLTEDNVIWKFNTPEDESCYDAIVDCINSGCTLIVCNGYGHQSFCQEAAEKYPDVQFTNMTGDTAKASGLANFHNAFNKIYEARYLSGVVAGLKIKELAENGELKDKNFDADGNVKIGYVGAYPYAEVVSGYSSFYLGVKSQYEKVVMDVQYTNSWFNITAENEAALALIDSGCVVIGQHADSTGAPSACEEKLEAGQPVYSVGYNVDMRNVAPKAALTSPQNNWDKYYTYCFEKWMNGESYDTNWTGGYAEDAVQISPLGDNCTAETTEVVEKTIAGLADGSIQPFDTETFTVGGEKVTEAFATDTDGDWVNDADNAVFDGYYHESYFQSAPSFSLRIDGIKELN